MPTLSFRDRFYSPAVSRALTSPSGILALGGGVAAGIVVAAVAAAALPVTVAAAVAGGVIGYGGRVALALPRAGGDGRDIDPFAVNEPWRRSVQGAQRAQSRFRDAVGTFRPGPLRDSMTTVGGQFDDAVGECWRVAKQGQIVAEARTRINDREVRWQLAQNDQAVKDGKVPNQTQQQTIAALHAQLATADRMDALIATTKDQLDLLTARLDESVTRAIELSVSNRLSDASDLGDDVGAIVTDLESLRIAIEDVDRSEDIGSVPDSGSAAGPASSSEAQAPPLPAPPVAQGGEGQTSPGT